MLRVSNCPLGYPNHLMLPILLGSWTKRIKIFPSEMEMFPFFFYEAKNESLLDIIERGPKSNQCLINTYYISTLCRHWKCCEWDSLFPYGTVILAEETDNKQTSVKQS